MQDNKRGTIYLTIYSLVFIVTSYISNVFLARYLGPVNYGIYGIVISIIGIINLVQSAGVPQAVSKYVSAVENESKEVLRTGLLLQLISAILLSLFFFFASPSIARTLNDVTLVKYLQFSALVFPFYGLFSLYIGYYNGKHSFNKQAIINIIYVIVKSFLAIVLVLKFQIFGVITAFILAPLTALFLGIHFPGLKGKYFSYKALIKYSIPLIGFSLIAILQQSVDLYFIKALVKYDEASGYYAASQNIARIPFILLSAITVVLFPSISKHLSNNNMVKVKNLIRSSLRITLILLVPITVLISFTSSELIHLIFSEQYVLAASSLSILTFGFSFFAVFTLFANILNGANDPIKSFLISTFALTSSLVCYLFLIPKYGIEGAAFSTALGFFIAMIISAYYVFKKFQTLMPFRSIIKITIASCILIVVINILPNIPILLPIIYLFMMSLYIFTLVLLKEITILDLNYINLILPTKLKFQDHK